MYEYTIYENPGICIFRGTGNLKMEEFKKVAAKMIEDPRWQTGWSILYDFSRANSMDVTSRQMKDGATRDRQFDDLLAPARIAVVATQDSMYGMFRMWQMLSEERSAEIKIFKDLDSAFSWLGVSPKNLGYDMDPS